MNSPQFQPQLFVDTLQEDMARTFGGKALKTSKAMLAKTWGREIRYSVSMADYPYDTARLRIFIIGTLMYAPMVVGTQAAIPE